MGSRDEDLHLVEAVALSMFYVAGGKARTPDVDSLAYIRSGKL